ncbi:NAD(P)-binding Rossmann-fold superfamily protein isoform 3 [Hibiscus syriacus]|uniref:NAD(P)-binding Rossmann-fold superfamily protein isoform 3 n=1 Tax=Hibiscus syriacus TaxID=106335 RepID=A0A6A3AE38_HIBSY|nr:NAD(P)-binding Rossmann-fold superfamily protein isoform 3 [Hibiscus syriacus]
MTSFRAFLAVSAPPLSSLGTTAFFPTRPDSLPQRRSFLFHSFCKFGVKCSYAEAGISDDSRSATIDVVADVKNERIVVLGGSGFVGSAICKAAVSKGIDLLSLSSEEQMKRINGEANVVAVNAAKDFGIPIFILISVHDYNLPLFLLQSAYFTSKRKAESEVLSKYPNSGVVLRPGFIYRKRRVDGFELPLDLVGEPLEKVLSAVENFTKPFKSLPSSDLILAPPVSVDNLAYATINAVTDDDFGVFTIEQIKEAAAKVKV